MKKYLIILFILSYSCVNKEKTINQEQSEEIIEDSDFPVVSVNYAEFKTNIPKILDDGPSFTASITFKNNTTNNITKFEIDYYIKGIFKDNEIYYYPTFWPNEESDDLNAFDFTRNYFAYQQNNKKSPIWKPQEERTYDFIVYKNERAAGSGISNFYNSVFERTPTSLIFAYRYKAISVDAEYENYYSYDILELWTDYQSKIGLR